MAKKFSNFAETSSHLPKRSEGREMSGAQRATPRTTSSFFSAKEAIQFGWQIMKHNFWFFVGLLVVAGLLTIVPDLIADSLKKESPGLSLVLEIVGSVFSIIITLGLIKISLNFCDNVKGKIAALFSQYQLFFRFLFASIVYGLIVFAGLILLIVPGIYWAIRLQFYQYFIVDRDSRIKESLKRSWDITRGNVCNLFLFNLLLGLINLLGMLALIVGLFATIPTTMVAVAFVYRKLLSQTEPAPAVVQDQKPPEPLTPPLTTPFA